MMTRFRQPVWIVPLAIAGLVAVFGWWANIRLRETIEEQLKAGLTATLNANVTALEIWMTNQTRLATFLAEEPKLRPLATGILEKSGSAANDLRDPQDLPEASEFGNYLRPRLSKVNYDAGQLVSTNFVVVANS